MGGCLACFAESNNKAVSSNKPPAGAVQTFCDHVYDGDTLTLAGGDRVRLLGIDAPELKQKQSYAAESRDYVKKLCEKKQLFLEYGPEAKDHYGRTLAFIWVQQSDGEFVLVNERVLSVGLARFYTPGKEPLQHGEVMLRSQAAAKSSKSGIWKDFTSKEVIVTKFGKAYHKQGCKHLANSKNTFVRCESDVLDQGLSPCRECVPSVSHF